MMFQLRNFLAGLSSFQQHDRMIRCIFHNMLKAAVSSGSEDEVLSLLSRAAIFDIHGYLCEELPAEHKCACASCNALLMPPLRQRDTDMIMLLLRRGAYPPLDICASEYRYDNRDKTSTPLKRAVESGSRHDVKKLLSAGADVNAHPRM